MADTRKLPTKEPIGGFIGSGSWDGRRASPQRASPSGASGVQGQSLWLFSPGHWPGTMPLYAPPASVPSSFKFPGETLVCPACSPACQHQGVGCGQRTACNNQAWPVGAWQRCPPSLCLTHIPTSSHLHQLLPSGREKQEAVPRPGNRNKCTFLLSKTCLQLYCLQAQCCSGQGFGWVQGQRVEGKELVLFSQKCMQEQKCSQPTNICLQGNQTPLAQGGSAPLPFPVGMTKLTRSDDDPEGGKAS